MKEVVALFQGSNQVPATIVAAVAFALGAIVMCLLCKLFHRPCGGAKKGACNAGGSRKPARPSAPRQLPPSDGTTEIYVGNLSYDLTEQVLADAFKPFGTVTSARIVLNRYTNKSKGFGFVHMPNRDEAEAAIAALNDKDLAGRKLKCNIAKNAQ